MNKTKVIKGAAIYLYHGKQYLSIEDAPKELLIKSMLYDEDAGITYVKLKHKSYLYEIIILTIISICVYISIIHNRFDVTVYASSLVTYYNGNLYLNWQNPEENTEAVTMQLYDGNTEILSMTLQPGESYIMHDIDYPSDRYTVYASIDNLFRTVSDSMDVVVLNKDEY